VERWSPALSGFYGARGYEAAVAELKKRHGVGALKRSEFIIDVASASVSDGYKAVIEPLEKELRRIGVRGLTIGGSRKVTEELHCCRADRRLASRGGRQSTDFGWRLASAGAAASQITIGPRATILAFNRDSEAPLMTLNQRQHGHGVLPVIGDFV